MSRYLRALNGGRHGKADENATLPPVIDSDPPGKTIAQLDPVAAEALAVCEGLAKAASCRPGNVRFSREAPE
jgi:hypothetical protein